MNSSPQDLVRTTTPIKLADSKKVFEGFSADDTNDRTDSVPSVFENTSNVEDHKSNLTPLGLFPLTEGSSCSVFPSTPIATRNFSVNGNYSDAAQLFDGSPEHQEASILFHGSSVSQNPFELTPASDHTHNAQPQDLGPPPYPSVVPAFPPSLFRSPSAIVSAPYFPSHSNITDNMPLSQISNSTSKPLATISYLNNSKVNRGVGVAPASVNSLGSRGGAEYHIFAPSPGKSSMPHSQSSHPQNSYSSPPSKQQQQLYIQQQILMQQHQQQIQSKTKDSATVPNVFSNSAIVAASNATGSGIQRVGNSPASTSGRISTSVSSSPVIPAAVHLPFTDGSPSPSKGKALSSKDIPVGMIRTPHGLVQAPTTTPANISLKTLPGQSQVNAPSGSQPHVMRALQAQTIGAPSILSSSSIGAPQSYAGHTLPSAVGAGSERNHSQGVVNGGNSGIGSSAGLGATQTSSNANQMPIVNSSAFAAAAQKSRTAGVSQPLAPNPTKSSSSSGEGLGHHPRNVVVAKQYVPGGSSSRLNVDIPPNAHHAQKQDALLNGNQELSVQKKVWNERESAPLLGEDFNPPSLPTKSSQEFTAPYLSHPPPPPTSAINQTAEIFPRSDADHFSLSHSTSSNSSSTVDAALPSAAGFATSSTTSLDYDASASHTSHAPPPTNFPLPKRASAHMQHLSSQSFRQGQSNHMKSLSSMSFHSTVSTGASAAVASSEPAGVSCGPVSTPLPDPHDGNEFMPPPSMSAFDGLSQQHYVETSSAGPGYSFEVASQSDYSPQKPNYLNSQPALSTDAKHATSGIAAPPLPHVNRYAAYQPALSSKLPLDLPHAPPVTAYSSSVGTKSTLLPLTTNRLGRHGFPPAAPVARFGFGGKLIVMIPVLPGSSSSSEAADENKDVMSGDRWALPCVSDEEKYKCVSHYNIVSLPLVFKLSYIEILYFFLSYISHIKVSPSHSRWAKVGPVKLYNLKELMTARPTSISSLTTKDASTSSFFSLSSNACSSGTVSYCGVCVCVFHCLATYHSHYMVLAHGGVTVSELGSENPSSEIDLQFYLLKSFPG